MPKRRKQREGVRNVANVRTRRLLLIRKASVKDVNNFSQAEKKNVLFVRGKTIKREILKGVKNAKSSRRHLLKPQPQQQQLLQLQQQLLQQQPKKQA